MKTLRLSALTLLLAVGCHAAAADLPVEVTVTEPAGVARRAFPAAGGIPFAAGQVKSIEELTLLDSEGKPAAAQFTTLASHPDGSVMWALVDTLVDLPARGKAAFTIARGTSARPASPLKITETAEAVSFDTGVVEFSISKTDFNLLESVRAGGKPIASGGEAAVEGGRGVWAFKDRKTKKLVEYVNNAHAGKRYQAQAPTRVKWEYRGPVRATLRVDGRYMNEGDAWLGYTARITAWAGSGLVRVEFALRNSNPTAGNDAFIARAPLTLDLAFDAADQGRGEDWAGGGDGSVGLLIYNRHTAGIYRGPSRFPSEYFGSSSGWPRDSWKGLFVQQVLGRSARVEIVAKAPETKDNGRLGFTREGVFALADRAHKESEVWFDVYTGVRDEKANGGRAAGCRSKLLIVAPGEWYGETGVLSVGKFGTLADEIATYKEWGWKGGDDEKKHPHVGYGAATHEPLAFMPKNSMHNVSEDDAAQGFLLQFLRTGARGFFDYGEAVAGFYRGHAIYRTDWGEAWETTGPTGKRENKGLEFGWYGPHAFDWSDSRMHRCHHYGRGIFDYYCLTGNIDSLEAGLDLAEQMSGDVKKLKVGGSFKFGRAFGRQFLTFLRAYQVTGDEKWKALSETCAQAILKGANWNPELKIYMQDLGIKNSYFARAWTKGHFDAKSNPRWEKMIASKPDLPNKLDKYLTDNGITCRYDRGAVIAGRGDKKWKVTYLTQLFELSACHMAMERYAALFDSAPMKKRLVEVSEGVAMHYWSPVVDYMIGSPWFGWPDEGVVLDPYKWSDKKPGEFKISGYATRYTADMFARAYEISGDAKFLELAKRSWSRGSKRGYQRLKPMAGPNEVGMFAYVRGTKENTLTECSARLFYLVPRDQRK